MPAVEPPKIDMAEPSAASESAGSEGLTQTEICDRYGLSFQNITRNSRRKGLTVLEYLAERTGQRWVQRGKRYHLI